MLSSSGVVYISGYNSALFKLQSIPGVNQSLRSTFFKFLIYTFQCSLRCLRRCFTLARRISYFQSNPFRKIKRWDFVYSTFTFLKKSKSFISGVKRGEKRSKSIFVSKRKRGEKGVLNKKEISLISNPNLKGQVKQKKQIIKLTIIIHNIRVERW